MDPVILKGVSITAQGEFKNIFSGNVLIITMTGVTAGLWCIGARHLLGCGTVSGQEELFPPKYQEGSGERRQSIILCGFSPSREEGDWLAPQVKLDIILRMNDRIYFYMGRPS